MQTTQFSPFCFTKKQMQQISQFKEDLEKGNVDFAFEGTILEGMSFLNGAGQIVKAFNH